MKGGGANLKQGVAQDKLERAWHYSCCSTVQLGNKNPDTKVKGGL